MKKIATIAFICCSAVLFSKAQPLNTIINQESCFSGFNTTESKSEKFRIQSIECLDNGFESGVGYWNHQWISNNPCFILSPITPSPGSSLPGWFYDASCAFNNPPFPPSTILSQNTFFVANVARPGGGVNSMRIGSGYSQGNGGTGIEISKTFSIPVSGNNAFLSYWYKLDLPQGYDVGQAFEVTVSTSGCSGGFYNTYNLSPNVVSPLSGPWTNQTVSLCNKNGCTVTIKFKIKGCSNFGHPVNVYVDDICLISESTPAITPVSPLCSDVAPITLVATPSGGTFGGPGVSGTTFNPTIAGVGTHTITYSYLSPSGCGPATTVTTNITVNPLPAISFTPPSTYCINNPPINLNTFAIANPPGGNFSGTGVSGTIFNPSVAGVGTHTISYVYTDPATGCGAAAAAIIVVNYLPAISFSPPVSFCINDAASDLNVPGIVNLTGGTFSGPGITGSTFNPAVAGLGAHPVTYSYTDPLTGCSNSATTTITVYPTVTQTQNISLCDGQNYTLPDGVVITAPGTYISNVLTPQGCDNTITTIATCCACGTGSLYNVNYQTSVPAPATIPLLLACSPMEKGKTYLLKCNVPVTLNGSYNCTNPPLCSVVKVTITPPAGPASTHTLPYVFTPTVSGTYTVIYHAYCGTTLCKTCNIRFNVQCQIGTPLPGGTPRLKTDGPGVKG